MSFKTTIVKYNNEGEEELCVDGKGVGELEQGKAKVHSQDEA